MFCVTLTTESPEELVAALRRAKVRFQLGAVREDGSRPAHVAPEAAQRIYDQVAAGVLTLKAVAVRNQVSYHTLLRIIQNPKKYGVKGKPIRRSQP